MPFVADKQQPSAPPAAARPRFVPDEQQATNAPAGPSALRQAAMAPVGAAEMIAQGVTGAVAAIPAAAAYGGAAIARAAGADVDPAAVQQRTQNYFTYQPSSDSARAGDAALTNMVAPVVAPIAKGYGAATDAVAAQSPIAGDLMRAAPGALQAASALVPGVAGARTAMTNVARPAAANGAADIAVRALTNAPTAQSVATKAPIATTAEDVLARAASSSDQNMGAAAASVRLDKFRPEVKAAIVEAARKNGGAVNPTALTRHADVESLPVKVPITEGQATGDVALLSHEFNMKGKIPEFGKVFDEQNKALGKNLQTIRDEVGPDVFSANHVEHGDTLINAYKTVDSEREANVSAAYQALRDAAGGQFPVGAKTLLDNASRELHAKLLFDHAPPSIMKTLDRLASNPGAMTFENFESMRTNLATVMRTATDGNERRAAGIIRQAMEDLPLVPGAARLKPLADKARALARERFAAIESDPAYEAAINDSVPPDRFVQRFVTGGTRDEVARMAQTIGHDDTARQTMGVAALDYLRDAAKLSPGGYEGNFAAQGFNKALRKLSPSLRSLLPAATSEALETLDRVAGYTTFQPRGSSFNNSHTFVSAAAEGAKEGAKGAAEGAANFSAAGIPVGTWIRQGMEGASHRRAARRSMAPGAGLDRLPESP